MENEMADNLIVEDDIINLADLDEVGDDLDNEGDDNNITYETADDADSDTEKVEETISKTKAYSERLNKDREKMQRELEEQYEEKLNMIAKSRNFDSWEELEEYDRSEKISNMGIDNPDEFKKMVDEMIKQNPVVLEAQRVIESKKKEDQDAYIKEQITEISKLDKNVKSLNDLVALDKYNEFASKLDKGYSLVDAYKLTYFDRIKNNEVESAKESVISGLEGKSHLKTIGGKGSKDVNVPDDIYATYKKNMPDMSDEEIKKHYSSSIGGK